MNHNLSVVITTCDRPTSLNLAIESVLKYCSIASEIIIVDNGITPAIISKYNNSSIRHFILRSNIGSQRAREVGFSLSKSEWILYLDDDDELISPLLDFFLLVDKNRHSLILSSSIVNNNNKIFKRIIDESSLNSKILVNNPFTFSGTLIHNSLYKSLGGMMNDLNSLQDWDLWIRAYKFNKDKIFINSKIFTKINISS
jgi:hypothetical protein